VDAPKLQAIVLAFNADWSIRGGLSYLADTLRGDEPCELCRITYGGVTKKGAWKACERDIRAPVEEVYRNQASAELRAVIDGAWPMVLARTDQGYRVLVRPEAMHACGGDPTQLHALLLEGLDAQGIVVGS